PTSRRLAGRSTPVACARCSSCIAACPRSTPPNGCGSRPASNRSAPTRPPRRKPRSRRRCSRRAPRNATRRRAPTPRGPARTDRGVVAAEARVLAMFPLGNALLPGGMLPLHVFETRYRVMVRELVGGDGEFGVVLISRGHEVGGGDTRENVGCRARIARAE